MKTVNLKGGKKRGMKKTLFFSLMLGVLLTSSLSFVIAIDQGVNVTIGENVSLVISPETLTFGSLLPGTTNNPATNGPIEFDATGSNSDVEVEVTDVTGFPFEDGLMFDGSSPIGQSWSLDCVIVNNECTHSTASTVPTLDIPANAPSGSFDGTITYTVTGTPPGP